MNLEYNIKYILSWLYHNVIQSDATAAIVRILILIGLVSLLVYREFILFLLLCIVVISAEVFLGADTGVNTFPVSFTSAASPRRVVDKDELTTGVSLYDNLNEHEHEHGGRGGRGGREGFSVKIIKGDDSGVDHRRYNKFVEEDSRDFTDKYFNSKRCSIGSSAGGITMFGSNELLGDSRTTQIGGIYDFAGKVVDNTSNNTDVNGKRYIYFKECVHDPITRYDFRAFKKEVYNNVNTSIINIQWCLNRFNVAALFSKTTEQINAKGILGGELIAGSDNTGKMVNIQPLNSGTNADTASDTTYSTLLNTINSRTPSSSAIKQREIDIYGKAYDYRKRIEGILSNIQTQTRGDAANVNTIQLTPEVTNELRKILAYFALIQRTNALVLFENKYKLFDITKTAVTEGKNELPPFTGVTTTDLAAISGENNIFRIPHDDTFNTNDEKRYLYGITYSFDKKNSSAQ